MFEYAYFDEVIKGNSKELVEYLAKIKKFFDSGILSELAYTAENFSYFAVREPLMLAVKVRGDIGEARFQALKLLKDLGYVSKEVYNLEEVFRFVEKIDKMPLEEFLREMKRLRGQL